MSLTSYRAAPPRVKPLLCLRENAGDGGLRADAVRVACFSRPKGFLGRQPRARPVGCEGYVPTEAAFGKGHEGVFFDFMTVHGRGFRPICHILARSSANRQLAATKQRRNADLGRRSKNCPDPRWSLQRLLIKSRHGSSAQSIGMSDGKPNRV